MSQVASGARAEAVPAAYRADSLCGARVDDGGVSYEEADGRGLLPWDRVIRAFAAEVGEPEGVRAIVFDLVLGREGATWVARRLDADPIDGASDLARAIADALGPERAAPSLKSLAADGTPSRWFPDLESFEEWVLALLR